MPQDQKCQKLGCKTCAELPDVSGERVWSQHFCKYLQRSLDPDLMLFESIHMSVLPPGAMLMSKGNTMELAMRKTGRLGVGPGSESAGELVS